MKSPAVPPSNEDHAQSPLLLLSRLLARLASEAEVATDAQGTDGTLERWEDHEYLYLEAPLAGLVNREVDISVHDGRVFIRLGR